MQRTGGGIERLFRARSLTLAATGLVAGSLALAGCGGSSSSGSSAATGGSGGTVGVSLILKTLTNPYFVSMKKDAQAAADKDNVNLTVAAGKQDGDTQIADHRHRQRDLPRRQGHPDHHQRRRGQRGAATRPRRPGCS